MDDEIEFDRCDMPVPDPVSLNGIRYESMAFGKMRGLDQNGGFITAIDESNNSELWILKVYDVIYDSEMEDDIQENFIKEMKYDGEYFLRVMNEHGEQFQVDVNTRTVKKLENSDSFQ